MFRKQARQDSEHRPSVADGHHIHPMLCRQRNIVAVEMLADDGQKHGQHHHTRQHLHGKRHTRNEDITAGRHHLHTPRQPVAYRHDHRNGAFGCRIPHLSGQQMASGRVRPGGSAQPSRLSRVLRMDYKHRALQLSLLLSILPLCGRQPDYNRGKCPRPARQAQHGHIDRRRNKVHRPQQREPVLPISGLRRTARALHHRRHQLV